MYCILETDDPSLRMSVAQRSVYLICPLRAGVGMGGGGWGVLFISGNYIQNFRIL